MGTSNHSLFIKYLLVPTYSISNTVLGARGWVYSLEKVRQGLYFHEVCKYKHYLCEYWPKVLSNFPLRCYGTPDELLRQPNSVTYIHTHVYSVCAYVHVCICTYLCADIHAYITHIYMYKP